VALVKSATPAVEESGSAVSSQTTVCCSIVISRSTEAVTGLLIAS
jgi:hypothetical protein